MKSNRKVFELLQTLEVGEKCTIHVSSDSMWPLIDINDQLILERTSVRKIAEFDIVVFYSCEYKKMMVHRAIDVFKKNEKTIFFTKGDNSLFKDVSVVTEENFLGKVIFVKNKKISLEDNNYKWLSFYYSNKLFLKIKQKLFYFLYNSRFNSFF